MDIFSHLISGSHQVKVFAILYIITFIPCWLTLFLAVKAIFKRQIWLFSIWSLSLVLLLFLPYGYILATTSLNIWQFWVSAILLTLFSYYRIFFSNRVLSVEWFWNWYAKNYDVLLYFEPYLDLVRDIAKKINNDQRQGIRVLELGCGTGNIAMQLTQNQTIQYLGIDSAEMMLNKAKKKLQSYKNFVFKLNDIEKEINDLGTEFDIVIVNNVLYALQDHEIVISKIRNKIITGGVFIVSEPLRNSSIFFLIKQFIQKGKMKSFLRILARLPSFIFLLVANIMILEIEHIKKKNFFLQEELEALIVSKGFKIDHSVGVYEKQNIMIVATTA